MSLISKQELIRQLNENHYSQATIDIYASWMLRFVNYHNLPAEQLSIEHIQPFLNGLSQVKKIKTSTYNQALNAIIFLYKKILKIAVDQTLIKDLRSSAKQNLPEVLSRAQINNIAMQLRGVYQLIVYLMYGCGLRTSEVLALKIKDIDLNSQQLSVGSSDSFRTLPIPNKVMGQLQAQIGFVSNTYASDIRSKFFKDTGRQECYLFPMRNLCNDAEGMLIRLPIISNTLNYNIASASKKAHIDINVTTQTFRHSYALHMLQNQVDLKTLQKLLGHKHISSTLVYTHLARAHSKTHLNSPLDLN